MQVRTALNTVFVEENIGVKSMTRDQLLNRNSEFIKVFCDNENNLKIALIGDATYIYIGKSSNNTFQR